jgi:N-acetyl-alpha-D-glucosaminyl L-malate synthase BshA
VKNILLYTDTPQVGGAELQMFLLAKFLDKKKFTPILACSSYTSLDRWCENFIKEGIKVLRLNVKHKHDPKHFFELRRIIKEEKIDLLHAHVWNPASCRYAFSAASSRKIPIVTTEHDPFKLSLIKNIFKKNSLKKTKTVVTVSAANQKVLKELYPEFKGKFVVIPNGIDTTWWHSQFLRFTDLDRKKIKEELFLANENSLIIISVAELHERKGLKYLIEAIPEVSAKFPNIKLVIVGEGPERNELEKLVKKLGIENHVTLTGRQKEIPKLLKCADIFVLPSRREAFGLVILEAMITGLPVIASATGGIPEIITDKKTGILVEPKNSAEISAALIDLIAHPEKRQKLSAAGEKLVHEKFEAKKMAEEYEKIYEEYLK